MMLLQPQVTLLDKFVIQQEAIPNLLPAIDVKQGQLLFANRTSNVMDSINENVCPKLRLYAIQSNFLRLFF